MNRTAASQKKNGKFKRPVKSSMDEKSRRKPVNRLTEMESVTVKSYKDGINPNRLNDDDNDKYSGLLADESFDLDVNVEDIDDEDYDPPNRQILKDQFVRQFDKDLFDSSKEEVVVDDKTSNRSSLAKKNRLAAIAENNIPKNM